MRLARCAVRRFREMPRPALSSPLATHLLARGSLAFLYPVAPSAMRPNIRSVRVGQSIATQSAPLQLNFECVAQISYSPSVTMSIYAADFHWLPLPGKRGDWALLLYSLTDGTDLKFAAHLRTSKIAPSDALPQIHAVRSFRDMQFDGYCVIMCGSGTHLDSERRDCTEQ